MIQLHTQNDLSTVSDKMIAKIFASFTIRENEVCIRIPKVRAEEYIKLKNLIEYKYCMPIQLFTEKNVNYFNLCRYSTYKFLKIIAPHLNCSNYKMQQIKKTLKACERARINIYAAGPIEKDPNGGLLIRQQMIETLRFTKSNLINPCDFDYNDGPSMSKFKEQHSLRESYWYSRKIVSGDVFAVKRVDIVALYINQYIGYGSTSECTVAVSLNKPVYAIIDDNFDIDTLNPWLLGCITRFFKSINEFRSFLVRSE
jgi:hypothetical protein